MRWLGPILLIGVFLRHDTALWLPNWYTPAAWFYVLGSLWEIALCAVLLSFLRVSSLATVALWIGILESGQAATCRLLTSDITKVKGNLCDSLTGLPIGATMTALYVILIAVTIARHWKRL
jgi:hypothetical protein